ncbi:MAG: alpha/beta hydrolase, partial [Candidatus Pacebacteria bacterium]|nr:alpha/beta hydrolase [Candidatus Paceibacterota bacterium]
MDMIKRVSIGLLFFLLAFLCYVGDVQADFNPLDLNGNEIADKDEAEVIVNSNVTLPSGEYFFNNLIISNNSVLTAEGDTNSASLFKGVKINAVNLTVLDGSSISADGEGYLPGGSPGSSISIQAGASYGGVGGWGGMSTYGSATHPTDLGSGSPYAGRGGGAIWLQVSETLTNEGVVSANGERSSSGGSIYLVSGSLAGSGVFEAKGGGYSWSSIYYGLGGGGRIAVYYGASSFSGESSASGGCGSLGMGYPYECAGSGTVGFFDTAANNFISGALWRFQQNDSPFNFNDIILSGGSETEIEDGANLSANNLTVNETSSLVIFGSPMLSIPTILIDGNSTITLSEKTLTAKSLTVTGNSIVTVAPEKILSLEIADITVDFGSSISADEKGYGYGTGLGAPDFNHYWAGASYGGVGYGNTSESVYGSEREPTDFGSGGNSGQNPRGGGAIRVISSGSFINNGAVSANGGSTSSGGSVYVSASNLTGGGAFYANGGNNYCSNSCFGSGGGGRIAVYYENSTFSGEAAALAGMYCFYGCSRLGENGTVVMEQTSPACTTDCFSNVLFLPGLMGSRLYEQGGLMDCSNLDPGTTPPMECFYDKELWVSRDDSNQTELGLDTNGKSINDIYTKNDTQNNGETDETGIIDDIYLSNIYQSFIYDLRDWKQNGLINEYAFIPYDWRLSLEDIITGGSASSDGNLFYTNTQDFSESFILKKLDELQKTSKSGKVTIVAHSNGGLVTKALVQKLQDTNNPLYEKIDKIIFVAVPQIGTPDALVGLLHGTELGFGFLMDKERSRQLAENMPTVYNLLPSNSYFTTVDPAFAVGKLVSFENTPFFNPQTSQYGVFVSNETELKNYVLGTDGRTKPSFGDTVHPNIGNSVLYDQAENVHQILDSWQPSPDTKVIQVAGWGEETLAGIDYKSIGGDATERLSYKPRMVVDGDGTVVVPSALWMATSSPNIERWWVDL